MNGEAAELDESSIEVPSDALAAEQAHLDEAYDRLDRARGRVDDDDAVTDDADAESAGGTHQLRSERFAEAAEAKRVSGHLRFGDAPLIFGRIDRTTGERFHVGRVGVADRHGDPLVVDWRAPVSEPFYRATGVDPLGLRLRRAFHCRGRRLLGLDDELFDLDDIAKEHLMGQGALLASLDAPRTGRMQDVVATVQAEQDEVIRSSLAGIGIVQGAAGTGKTVVALHRAAYLLYTYRHLLEIQGVLLVGPNSRFLDYVRDVLPALGEHAVSLVTVADLHPGVTPNLDESHPEVIRTAAVKGSEAMVAVIRRAVRTRQRPLRDPIDVPFHRYVLHIDQAITTRIVDYSRGRIGTHNQRRGVVEMLLFDELFAQFQRRVEFDTREGPLRIRTRDEFVAQAERIPAVVEILERIWPRLSATELLIDLFGGKALLAHACRGHLDDDDRDRLYRPRPDPEPVSGGDVALETEWSVADIALLQEAHFRLGPKFALRQAAQATSEDVELLADRVVEQVTASLPYGMDEVMEADIRKQVAEDALMHGNDDASQVIDECARAFGHVLIDEAQDLSPMAWRMIARRCPNQSMTIVGDLAQGTEAHAVDSWDDVVRHLRPRKPPRRHDLHINYRTPAEIVDVATPLRATITAATVDGRAVRRSGRPVTAMQVPTTVLVEATLDLAAAMADEFGRGKVAVVLPDVPFAAEVLARWRGRDPADALAATLAIHTPLSVKGLEFDAVVVVEPAAIVASSVRGAAALYVALTRATQRLAVVHANALPDVLAHSPIETVSALPGSRAVPQTPRPSAPHQSPVASDGS